jgi:hypothetical protein
MENNQEENVKGGGVLPLVLYVTGTILVLVLIKVTLF